MVTTERTTHKYVNDLGVAAYLMMHGYPPSGKNGKSIFFKVDTTELEDFDRLVLDYQPPNDFYTFDSCLMFLKKIDIQPPRDIDESTHKTVSDLGVAAYLLMHEYKSTSLGLRVVGKQGKYVYFNHPKGIDEEFNRLSLNYLTSQFQTYDSSLMGLKKIGEYMPSSK